MFAMTIDSIKIRKKSYHKKKKIETLFYCYEKDTLWQGDKREQKKTSYKVFIYNSSRQIINVK